MSNSLDSSGVLLHPKGYLVVRDGVEVSLSPMQYRMFEIIAGSTIGVSPEALFERIYTGMHTPMQGSRSIHIQRIHANKKLQAIKVRITSNRRHGGPGSLYKVEAA
jgi:DNA-binding response OmpR family regulator